MQTRRINSDASIMTTRLKNCEDFLEGVTKLLSFCAAKENKCYFSRMTEDNFFSDLPNFTILEMLSII